MAMRGLIALVLAGLVALGATACGADEPGGPAPGDLGSGDIVDGGGDVTPPCPFTAQQMSDFLGLTMAQEAACSFRADNSYSLASVLPSSKAAGLATYDAARSRAGQVYATVKDIDRGEKGYLAYKDIEAELFVIGSAASHVINLSGLPQFEKDPAGYEALLLRIYDAI
jgi:hypothetical protein